MIDILLYDKFRKFDSMYPNKLHSSLLLTLVKLRLMNNQKWCMKYNNTVIRLRPNCCIEVLRKIF